MQRYNLQVSRTQGCSARTRMINLNSRKRSPSPRPAHRGTLFGLWAVVALCGLSLEGAAQELVIERFGFTPDGRFEVVATGDPATYYRLLQGQEINQINQVSGLSFEGVIVTRFPVTGQRAFFRLHKVSREESLDSDGDGLGDVFEMTVGLDPFLIDSDDDGTNDADEDLDGDTLDGAQEQAAGTDPFDPDSDDDGWPDEAEFTAGSDPNDPGSVPIQTLLATIPVAVTLPALPVIDTLQYGVVLAAPGTELVLPAATGIDFNEYGLFLAAPTAEVVSPASTGATGISPGTTLALPLVEVTLPAAPDLASAMPGVVLATPGVEVVLAGTPDGVNNAPGLVLGRPPISVEFESP